MTKKIYIDSRAEKELYRFSEVVQEEFEKRFKLLRSEGKLEFPEARKITENLFEIRIKFQGAYRGFYAYVYKSGIIMLHFFRKKSQRTPLKNLRVAKKRLKQYE